MKKPFSILLLLCLFPIFLFAQQNSEMGFSDISNFAPKQYGGGLQNWAIDQDQNGLMYFGNSSGLLEYDGVHWRLYQVPNKTTIRSLTIVESGRIYVGAQGDLGYFEADEKGKLKFTSLKNFLPQEDREFSDVFQTLYTGGKIYFNTRKFVAEWDDKKNKFELIKSEEIFVTSFLVDDKIYLIDQIQGFGSIEDGFFKPIDGGEFLADALVYGMLSIPNQPGKMLIISRTLGMVVFDGKNFVPFKTEVDDWVRENRIYMGARVLDDGNFLLGSISGGAVVIDINGKLLYSYSLENGLQYNSVTYTYQDTAGDIWLGTTGGISKVSYSAPIRIFDERSLVNSFVINFTRYEGALFVATQTGVYKLDPATSLFKKIRGVNSQSWEFLDFEGELLVASSDGLMRLVKDQLIPIKSNIDGAFSIVKIQASKVEKDRIYLGTNIGIWAFRKSGGNWFDEGLIFENRDQVSSIVEEEDGSLWVGTYSSGLFYLKFKKDTDDKIQINQPIVKKFDKQNGLQEGLSIVVNIDGKNFFNTYDSLYHYNIAEYKFIADTSFIVIKNFYAVSDGLEIDYFDKDNQGNLWHSTKGKLRMGVKRSDGDYDWLVAPFNRVGDEGTSVIFTEANGIVWIATESGIFKYDLSKISLLKSKFNSLIRNVTIAGDSVIFYGGKMSREVIPEFPFAANAIRFDFAATSYTNRDLLLFSTFLEGFDKDWSVWNKEVYKEYTNLPPGSYTFYVKAQDAFEQISDYTSYSFVILSPWYSTWWAYGFYILILALLVLAIIKWQRQRLFLRERQKSILREVQLKADAENEKRRNIELISDIGKEITASLSVEGIIDTVYLHVNKLMDATVFGIGLYNRERNTLDFPATKEKGETLPFYHYQIEDKGRPATWCFIHKKEIKIGDYENEHQEYVEYIPAVSAGDSTVSLIYLPLSYKEKTIGVLTAQSFIKNAYSELHFEILRSIGTYAALALANAESYLQLKSTQEQLIHAEKMASLGELTAGIAHEIQNPLNFVNNFAEVSCEMLEEIQEEREKYFSSIEDQESFQPEFLETESELMTSIKQNLEKIKFHGKRAESIVKGMLAHSRTSSGEKVLTDLNVLLDEYLRLSYQGLRARNKGFNSGYKTDFDPRLPKCEVVPQDFGRAILNLITNAFQACAGFSENPLVSVSTQLEDNNITIIVEDNGSGVPEAIKSKIFQPFFTTKPTGQGTGLGLSLAYDIVKAHGGELQLKTTEGLGSSFIIVLPLR
jgi:signal transduction histidine kinase/ligand-binding sensor domain-containing protein